MVKTSKSQLAHTTEIRSRICETKQKKWKGAKLRFTLLSGSILHIVRKSLNI